MRFALVLLALALSGCPGRAGVPVDAGVDAPYDPVTGNSFAGPITLDDNRVAAIDPTTLPAGSTPCRAPVLARVYEIADGDTFSATGIDTVLDARIRFIGVNTPEIAHPPAPAECYSYDAADFTGQLLDRTVWLTFDNTCLDPYDRLLAYVYIGPGPGDFWQRQLLQRGYARQLTVGDDRTFSAEFASDQATAQANHAGLWGLCP
jgi:endonuclease YncB( thermonuclease family)